VVLPFGRRQSGRRFSRKHDIILFYTGSGDYVFNGLKEKSYNRGLKPYRFQGVAEYRDSTGWYTLVGMKDYWEINMVGRTSRERLNYPTQKPLALLERIVSASSKEGDIVLDAFCGSGTALAAAERLGRRWIGIDISPAACKLARQRLRALCL
jgi:site-specific DNA-methyltransferase (adenine-specific)